jgi:murein DD-endopeptidase MepM/ murein hydrolase activator NlpD
MKILIASLFLCSCGAGFAELQSYNSREQEYTSVQIVGTNPPKISTRAESPSPALSYIVEFSGKAGQPASHEGIDYVHNNPKYVDVAVFSVLKGTVVYVRYGCPQSAMFTRNLSLRECGAGWGNHVVIQHEGGFYTRYAHLKPASIKVSVGDTLEQGTAIALMGNSGRSELRHLHFELGTKKLPFVDKAPAQNFDYVYNPIILFQREY